MERHFFLRANSSLGRTDFLDNELTKYKDIITLHGYPRGTAAALIHECYTLAKQGHLEVNIVHNSLDQSPEGILFPGLSAGIINTPIYEPRCDVAALFTCDALAECQKNLENATNHLKTAKKIHDDWEKVYIASTDYNALNRLADDTIIALIDGHSTGRRGVMYDRFFGATTINGPADYIDVLTEGYKRYFIKGRPGTGKSTFLKKLAQSAFDEGMTVERYHCSFDPNSLDMVIIRELALCFFDSTTPHEYFPSRAQDEIIDFYEIAVSKDADTQHADELSAFKKSYKQNIEKAIGYTIAANEACKQAEASYESKLSKDRLMEVRKSVLSRIFP